MGPKMRPPRAQPIMKMLSTIPPYQPITELSVVPSKSLMAGNKMMA
jgi:hypothetical protein